MTALERSYRRLLTLHPADGRREELLATLMATSRPGQRRPGLGTTMDVLAYSGRRRVGLAPGQPLLGILALVGPLTLGVAGAMAAWCLVAGEIPWTGPTPYPGNWSVFFTLGVPTYLLIVAAAVTGARVLAFAGLCTAPAVVALAFITGINRPPLYVLLALALLLITSVLAPDAGRAWHRAAAAVLAAVAVAPAGAVLFAAGESEWRRAFYRGMNGGLPDNAPLITLVMALGLICAAGAAVRDRRWAGGGPILAIAVSPLALATPEAGGWFYEGGWLTATSYGVVALSAVAVGVGLTLWLLRGTTAPLDE